MPLKLPPIAAMLTPTAIGYLAFHDYRHLLPSNVVACALEQVGFLVAAYDDASTVIDCERDPATGQWVWASLAPTAVPG